MLVYAQSSDPETRRRLEEIHGETTRYETATNDPRRKRRQEQLDQQAARVDAAIKRITDALDDLRRVLHDDD